MPPRLPLDLPVLVRPHLDNSILGSNGRCPRLAFYNYHLCRSARAQNFPINFGSAYHTFRDTLEKLYLQWVVKEGAILDTVSLTIKNTASALATKEWVDPPLEHKKGYLDIGRLTDTFENAFDAWVTEKRNNYYKVVATEAPFVLPLPRLHCRTCFSWHEESELDKDVNGAPICPNCQSADVHVELFAGKIDQIIEWNGQLWVRDWKTVGRKEDWSKKYNPDHQFTGYTWAAKQLSGGRRVAGTIIDIVYNIKTIGPEFYPTLCTRSQGDIDFWLEWVETEITNYRRSEATGIWPMRTSACNDYGGCFFRECCHSGSWPSIQNWLEQRTIYSVWDPLNPEREEGLPE